MGGPKPSFKPDGSLGKDEETKLDNNINIFYLDNLRKQTNPEVKSANPDNTPFEAFEAFEVFDQDVNPVRFG